MPCPRSGGSTRIRRGCTCSRTTASWRTACSARSRTSTKVYYARVDGALEPGDIAAFAAGMTLGDGLECLPAGLEILSPTEALVTLREGKFHQVKRMLAARGKPVLYLKRLSHGAAASRPRAGPRRMADADRRGAFGAESFA